jgi:nicotinamidase-related amidase
MPDRDNDLHGNAPDDSAVALLLIDMINDFEFEDGEKLFKYAQPAAQRIAELKRRCKALGIPVIYVNDNWGRWQSNLDKLVEHVVEDDVRGRPVGELLQPDADDYFVLKPKQSGFFATTLETLLEYLKARTLILTGVAGDMCVLFTANDAYMRDYKLVIPADCIASNDEEANRRALTFFESILKADTTPSCDLDLESLKRGKES